MRLFNGYKHNKCPTSGLNTRRSGLHKLLAMVRSRSVRAVAVTYPDRLTRFGFEYLQSWFADHGVEVLVLHPDDDQTAQKVPGEEGWHWSETVTFPLPEGVEPTQTGAPTLRLKEVKGGETITGRIKSARLAGRCSSGGRKRLR